MREKQVSGENDVCIDVPGEGIVFDHMLVNPVHIFFHGEIRSFPQSLKSHPLYMLTYLSYVLL